MNFPMSQNPLVRHEEVEEVVVTALAAEAERDDDDALLLGHQDAAHGIHLGALLAAGASRLIRLRVVEPPESLVAHADGQGGGDERAVAEAHVEREALHRPLDGLPASVSLLACALDPTPPVPWLAGKWLQIHAAVHHVDRRSGRPGRDHGWRRASWWWRIEEKGGE